MNIRRRQLVAGLLGASAIPALAAGPTVRIIVPYPAGGGADIATRLIGQRLASELKSTVIIENKPGASMLIGAQAGINAPADGSVLTYIASGLVTLQAMGGRVDILRQMKPVAMLGTTPFVLVVKSDAPYGSIADLLKAIRQSPGKLTYGSAGPGSPAHMAVEYLQEKVSGFNALHVPYKGAAESINAVRSGEIDFSVLNLAAAMNLIKSAQLKPLAVTTPSRIAALPAVPTIAEAGVPGYSFDTWWGIAMPASASAEVVAKMSAALRNAMQNKELLTQLEGMGIEPSRAGSAAEFASFIATDLENEKRIVAKLGLAATK